MRGGEWVVEWKVDGELIRRKWDGYVNGVVKRRSWSECLIGVSHDLRYVSVSLFYLNLSGLVMHMLIQDHALKNHSTRLFSRLMRSKTRLVAPVNVGFEHGASMRTSTSQR
jgi:hypothetical protein